MLKKLAIWYLKRFWADYVDPERYQQLQARQERRIEVLTNTIWGLETNLRTTEREVSNLILDQVVAAEKHRQELAELQWRLGRDDLTGLLRRDAAARAFRRHAAEGERRTKRVEKGVSNYQVSALFIDIDHFKQVNDRFDHAMGDRVLATVAKTVSSLLRETDIPCRRGGEEIVVILDNASIQEAITAAERMRQAVEALRFPLADGKTLFVTISIGVARVPLEDYPGNPDEALEAGIRWADMAMYRAKTAGRNRTFVSPE